MTGETGKGHMTKGAHISLIVGVTIRAPAAAVKAGRDRGPSVTHRRAKEQAAEAAAAEQKKAKKPSTKKALGAALGLAGVAAAGIVYGRVRLHSSPHSAVNATGEERRNSLMDKGWARRTEHRRGQQQRRWRRWWCRPVVPASTAMGNSWLG